MDDKKTIGVDWAGVALYTLGIGSLIFWIGYFITHINIFSIILTSVLALWFILCVIRKINPCGRLETAEELLGQYGAIAFMSFLIWLNLSVIGGIIGIILSVFVGIFCLLSVLAYLNWAKYEWLIDKLP